MYSSQTGSSPLAIFAHGNHDPLENSSPGYIYLCELLASYWILAATIDVNFFHGFNRGENDGRAIVFLEHIRQFALWNSHPGHPLHGKIDLSKVTIVGHNRGGEAVVHAGLFNRLSEEQPDLGSPGFLWTGLLGLARITSLSELRSGSLRQTRNTSRSRARHEVGVITCSCMQPGRKLL